MLLSGNAQAGPEVELYRDRLPSTDPIGIASATDFPTDLVALSDVNQLLAAPAYADRSPGLVDPNLATTEHPMIPLPSSLWVGLILMGGVALYAARQQRTSQTT